MPPKERRFYGAVPFCRLHQRHHVEKEQTRCIPTDPATSEGLTMRSPGGDGGDSRRSRSAHFTS